MKVKMLNGLRGLFRNRLLERWLVHFTVGRTYGNWVTKLPPNHYQYPKGTFREAARDGISYKLDISDLVDWYIYYGFKDPAREKLLSLITPNANFIDIGANVGQVTLHASRLIAPHGRVIAFEPSPFNLKRLSANLELNRVKNVTVEQLGLGDQAGSFLISSVDEGNQGMNRIVQQGAVGGRISQIQVTTLDAYVVEHELARIDLIKIDVEGFELKVLNGAKATLQKWHPALFIELDDANLKEQGSSARQLVDLLISMDYSVTHAETEQVITVKTAFHNCHYDIVARRV